MNGRAGDISILLMLPRLHPCVLSAAIFSKFAPMYTVQCSKSNWRMKLSTPTSSNGINTTASHDASLDRSQIGSPADGRKLNGSGSLGSGVNSGIAASQNSEVRPVVVKQVDHNALIGSNRGDHRAPNTGAGVTDSFKNQAGPRGETTDTPNAGA